MYTEQLDNLEHSDIDCPNDLFQFIGRIRDSERDKWIVGTKSREYTANQAASCLLRPHAGDRVLAMAHKDEAWILAVLDRETGECSSIETDGALRLCSRTGDVTVEALDSVRLKGHAAVEIDSPRFGMRVGLAELVSSRVQWICDRLEGRFNLARVAGRALERFVERFSSQARTSFREVQTIDQVRSGEIDYRAENNYVFRGRNLLGKGKDLAKIDADQIHMG